MIYSRWRPDKGGYDYFESAERLGMGDDLPTPKLGVGTSLGVASTDIGRTPGGALRSVGSGPIARGSILPMSRAGLTGLGYTFDATTPFGLVTALGVGAVAGAGLALIRGKRVQTYAARGAVLVPLYALGWRWWQSRTGSA